MLKLCPFCGGDAARREWDESRPYEPYGLIVNHDPGCFLNLNMNDDDPVFDAAWNTRHDEPLVEALRESLKTLTQFEGHCAYCGHAPDYIKPCVCGFNDAYDKAQAALAALAQWEKRNG